MTATPSRPASRSRHFRSVRRLAPLVALATLLGIAAAAAAAPAPPHVVSSLSGDDGVILEGYEQTQGAAPVRVELLRGGRRIGTAGPFTPTGGGIEINHLGSPGCWSSFTPDIVYGDVVRVTQGTTVEDSVIRNITVGSPVDGAPDTVLVHGTAQDTAGQPLDVAGLQVRLINQAFKGTSGAVGPSLRAPGAGAIAYDAPGGIDWTATFTGLTAQQHATAMNGATEVAALWESADLTEVTENVFGAAGGPVADCAASPAGRYATTRTTPNVVSNTTPKLVVEGAAHADATSVSVTLSDGDAGTTDPSVPGTLAKPADNGGQIWSATFTDSMVAGLADGVLTATPQFNDGAITGVARQVLKSPSGATTTITSGPSPSTTSRGAFFTFATNDPNATLECSLDTAPFAACASPLGVAGLALGLHTFRVRSVDADSVPSPTPAVHAWSVELPETALTGTPSTGLGTSATFGFTSPNDPAATFECARDGAAFAPCTSPLSLGGLAIGVHTFRVQAVDAAGNRDPTPAEHAWSVLPDTERPTVTATLGLLAKLTIGRNGRMVVRARCSERCTIIAKATIVAPSPKRRGKRKLYAIRSKTISSAGGATSQVRLTLSARQRLVVRNSLKAGKRVRITVTVIGTDPSGNTSNALRTVFLTRRHL